MPLPSPSSSTVSSDEQFFSISAVRVSVAALSHLPAHIDSLYSVNKTCVDFTLSFTRTYSGITSSIGLLHRQGFQPLEHALTSTGAGAAQRSLKG